MLETTYSLNENNEIHVELDQDAKVSRRDAKNISGINRNNALLYIISQKIKKRKKNNDTRIGRMCKDN